jgi:hypothetical protein
MRAVPSAVDVGGLLGVLEGVGSMVKGSREVGGSNRVEDAAFSESDALVFRGVNVCLRGVL